MLKSFDFPAEGGSLNNMKARLSDLLGDEASGRAGDEVDRLRWVFDFALASSITVLTLARNAPGLPSDWRGSVPTGPVLGITCGQQSCRR